MGINNVKNRIAEDAGKLCRRLFNNIVGLAFMGREYISAKNQTLYFKTKKGMQHMTIPSGTGVVIYARKYPVGLCVGSGDEIGWTEKIITPDMVGNKIAVFTSVERKAYGDKMDDEQIKWFTRVKEAGGIAEVYKENKDGAIERMSEI